MACLSLYPGRAVGRKNMSSFEDDALEVQLHRVPIQINYWDGLHGAYRAEVSSSHASDKRLSCLMEGLGVVSELSLWRSDAIQPDSASIRAAATVNKQPICLLHFELPPSQLFLLMITK